MPGSVGLGRPAILDAAFIAQVAAFLGLMEDDHPISGAKVPIYSLAKSLADALPPTGSNAGPLIVPLSAGRAAGVEAIMRLPLEAIPALTH